MIESGSSYVKAQLKLARQRAKMTQPQLAERLGVSLGTVQAIENNPSHEIGIDRLVEIIEILGTQPSIVMPTLGETREAIEEARTFVDNYLLAATSITPYVEKIKKRVADYDAAHKSKRRC